MDTCYICGLAEGEHGTELETIKTEGSSFCLCEEHKEQFDLLFTFVQFLYNLLTPKAIRFVVSDMAVIEFLLGYYQESDW